MNNTRDSNKNNKRFEGTLCAIVVPAKRLAVSTVAFEILLIISLKICSLNLDKLFRIMKLL